MSQTAFDLFRDPIWDGIAGAVAIIALFFAIYTYLARKKPKALLTKLFLILTIVSFVISIALFFPIIDKVNARFLLLKSLTTKSEEGSIVYLSRAINYDPMFLLAYQTRGVAYIVQEDYDQGIADLNRTIEIDDDPVNQSYSYYFIGYANHFMGHYDKAISNLSIAAELAQKGKGHPPIVLLAIAHRGYVYYESGDFESAIRDMDYLISLGVDNDASAFALRGKAFAEIGNFNQAIENLDRAIELESKNSYLHYERGLVQHKYQNHDLAIADFTKSLELNPTEDNLASNYCMRGDSYLALGQSEQAEADLLECLNIDQENVWTEFVKKRLDNISISE